MALRREAERERITSILDDIESELKSMANNFEQSIVKSKITEENMVRKEQQLHELKENVEKVELSPTIIDPDLKISLADLIDEIHAKIHLKEILLRKINEKLESIHEMKQ